MLEFDQFDPTPYDLADLELFLANLEQLESLANVAVSEYHQGVIADTDTTALMIMGLQSLLHSAYPFLPDIPNLGVTH